MLMSVIVWTLLCLIAGFIASKFLPGWMERAEGDAVTIDIERASEIATTKTVRPTGMKRDARTNVMRSRDITNTWSQL
jgi:hypothetical protein